jgi:IS5 family transposase
MRRFLGIDPTSGQVPDATTLANFRHIVESNRLDAVLFSALTAALTAAGVMWTGGTIADATFIESTSSTKSAAGKRDPEMHQARKGKNWHHGMKAHVGVDAGTGLAHTLTTTAANVSDLAEAHKLVRADDHTAFLDAGSIGIGKRDEVVFDDHLREMEWQVMPRQSTVKAVEDKAIASRLASMRAKVEHVFHIVKDLFGLRKTPYRGIAKNHVRITMSVLSANLYMLAMSNRRIDGSPLRAT